MALFKILRGNSTQLPEKLTDGYCYFTTDTGLFYVDYTDADGQIKRIPINAGASSTAVSAGALLDQHGNPYKLWVGNVEDLPPEEDRDPATIYFTNDEEEGGEILAVDVAYDNFLSGLAAGTVQVAIDNLAAIKQDKVAAKTSDMTQLVGRDTADGKLYASNIFDGIILNDTVDIGKQYIIEIQNGTLVTYLKA